MILAKLADRYPSQLNPRQVLALVVVFISFSSPPYNGAEVSRDVLALYDGAEISSPNESPIHRRLEVICDHIGLRLRYRDIRSGLPVHEEMTPYRGIITWYSDNRMDNARGYCEWLTRETELGRNIVVFGSMGAFFDDDDSPVDREVVNRLFNAWGVEYGFVRIDNPLMVQAASINPEFMNFERSLLSASMEETSAYEQFTILDSDAVTPLLELECPILVRPKSAVVAIHRRGGYAMNEYIAYRIPNTFRHIWYLNPFRFLRRALDWDNAPCPDITTLNGCRIFYSHVDGDGSVSVSERNRKSITIEVLYQEILTRFDFPFTVSVVEGEIATAMQKPWIQDAKRVTDGFKRIFALANVEPGAHGFSHPLDWSRGITAIAIDGYSRPARTSHDRALLDESIYAAGAIMVGERSEWETREILGSIDFVNRHLTLAGKPCRLFQWTGNCRPEPSALAVITENGLLNINGGDPRFDEFWPSYNGLCPAVRQVGEMLQVYTSGSNENLYTDLWKRNFGGFQNVVKTFEATGHPRRIKPINVYYHFYSAEKTASLSALKKIYNFCKHQRLAPLFTTQYIETVINCRKVNFARTEEDWHWQNASGCRTLRWDQVEKVPDVAASSGIIGYFVDRDLGVLYVHLDGSDTGWIRFTNKPRRQCYLSRATGFVSDWEESDSAVRFRFNGNGDSWIELGGLHAGRVYPCRFGNVTTNVRSNEDGFITLSPRGDNFRTTIDCTIKLD